MTTHPTLTRRSSAACRWSAVLPWFAVGLLGTGLLSACGGAAPPPSLLIITIDTLRADAVGATAPADGAPSVTPTLDALARSGTTFTAASTVTPLTLPAHASMFTALRPARHGLTVNGVGVAQLPVPTLAEQLSRAGLTTAAFVSSTVLDRRHGLDAGFAHYDDDLVAPGGPLAPTERRADHTVDRARVWLAEAQRPFFAWVHLFDPHAPYAAPGGRTGTGREAYLDEVAFVDRQCARLLEAAVDAASGPLLVVVLSDHGEGLGEHGEETHGLLLHEATVHVPWIVAWQGSEIADTGPGPGFPERETVRGEPVSILDLTPTVLQILGVPDEGALGRGAGPATDLPGGPLAADGRDGVSRVARRPDSIIPFETRAPWFYYGFSSLVGARRGDLKVVGAPRADPPAWMSYDLATDPGELAARPAPGSPLAALARSADPVGEADVTTSDETLAQFGYLSARPRAGIDGPLADPREAMELITTLDRANSALVEGRAGEAIEALDAAVERHGDVPEALLLLARALRADQRLGEAPAVLERALRADTPAPGLLAELGRTWLLISTAPDVAATLLPEAPDPVAESRLRAAAVLDRLLELLPADPDASAERALVDLLGGRPDLARQRLTGALARRPRHVALLTVQLRVARAEQRGIESSERALAEVAPDHPLLP